MILQADSHDVSLVKNIIVVDHIHTLLTTQGHGGPPQVSVQLNARATSEEKEH